MLRDSRAETTLTHSGEGKQRAPKASWHWHQFCAIVDSEEFDVQRFDHAESPSPYYWGNTLLSLT
jgi:hypothetical protein